MRKTPFVLAALLAVTGSCVLLWPVFTGHRLQADTDEAAQAFLEERKPEQSYPELLAALQDYNQRIYAEKQSDLTSLEACEEPAADLTTYGIEDEVIGVLEIPAMELTMPVYLGASDDHLAAGAAVLGNTSAPIGGDNTNCVIAGHRGWRGADYFRHIDTLELNLCKGDGTEENWSYHLNAAEQEVLARKMEAFCQQQNGMSLRDFARQLQEEPGPSQQIQM